MLWRKISITCCNGEEGVNEILQEFRNANMLQTFCGSAIWPVVCDFEGFPCGSVVKNPPAMQEMRGFDP